MINFRVCQKCEAHYVGPDVYSGLGDPTPTTCVRCGAGKATFKDWYGPCAVVSTGYWPLLEREPDAVPVEEWFA